MPPDLVSETQQKETECENKSCYRTVSTKKQVLWHLRQDHAQRSAERKINGTKLNCPVEDRS